MDALTKTKHMRTSGPYFWVREERRTDKSELAHIALCQFELHYGEAEQAALLAAAKILLMYEKASTKFITHA